jgi:hypothetical protein
VRSLLLETLEKSIRASANAKTLFFFVTDAPEKYAGVFVPIETFQLSQKFARKV